MIIQDIDTVMKELKHRLSLQSVTLDTLSDAMSFSLPDMDRESLKETLQELHKGALEGEEEFDRFANLEEEALKQEVSKRLSQALNPLPKSQQRQHLLLWYQALSQDFGYPVDGTVSRYLVQMPQEELREGIAFLLWKKGQELTGSAPSYLTQAVAECEGLKLDSDKQEMLFRAAVYIVLQKTGFGILPAEQIGQQIGFLKAFLKELTEMYKEAKIPVILRLLEIVSLAVAAYFLLPLLLTGEAVLFVITYIEKNHLWKLVIPAACSVVFYGWRWLSEHLLTDPIWYRMQGQAEDAKDEAAQYFAQIAAKAAEFVRENIEVMQENTKYLNIEQTVEIVSNDL